MPHAEVGEVIGKVRESAGHLCTRLAFEFLVLTAARSGRGATGGVGGDVSPPRIRCPAYCADALPSAQTG